VQLVALLTIRSLDEFRRFEHAAAAIMARHGGAIERALVLEGEPLRELHIVRFPDAASLAAYRADPELAALAALREAGVAETVSWTAVEGPRY
jgi:uncharacterized protein (DUF1330 family)